MTAEQIEKEYGKLSGLLADFVAEVTNQFRHAVNEQGIKLAFPADGRVKRLDSLQLKISSGVFTPKKSIIEVQDLAGFRFVTLFKSEIPEVVKVILSTFPDNKSYNAKDKYRSDQFGYSSLHFVISPPKSWKDVIHLARFCSLQLEIQVRTLSEHIWAECSHSLNYKSSVNVPPSIERPLHRLSALLELADSELDHIIKDHKQYKEVVEVLNISELLKEDLNALTLKKLLKVALPSLNAISDDQYASIDKKIEEDYNITKLPYLFEIIEKYSDQIPADQKLDHKLGIEIVLQAFKDNNFN